MVRDRIRRNLRLLLLPLGIASLAGCARPDGGVQEERLALQLARMTIEERAGQIVAAMLQISGDTATARLRAEISTGAAGALLVRAAEVPRGAGAVQALRNAARSPLLVVVELDSDSAGSLQLPPARLVASVASARSARAVGELAGRGALAVGGDIGLVTLSRLNGTEPLSAARTGSDRRLEVLSAYLEGARESGLELAVRALSSDDTSGATLRWDRARLDALELRELSNLIESEIGGVELAPVRLPALTGDSRPLPLSPAAIGGLLRRDLRFQGVVMADLSPSSLLVRELGAPEAAIGAVAAGADLLLGVAEPASVVDALVAAVSQGRLAEERLTRAAGRVLELGARLGVGDSIALQRRRAAAQEGRGSRVIDDPAVRIAREAAAGRSARGVDSVIAAWTRQRLRTRAGDDLAGGADSTASQVDSAGVEGSSATEVSSRGVDQDRPVATAPAAAVSASPGAAARAGGGRAGGHSADLPQVVWPPAPVLRPIVADSVGMEAAVVGRIDALMREALADSVFSAAAVAVGRRGGLVVLRGYGRSGLEGEGRPVDPRSTIFDIASLTKVIGTTTAVALLVDDGRMELDAPLRNYLPAFAGDGKEGVLIRHLLTHTSGLPSGLWLFGSASSPDDALRQVLEQRLLREPGERMEYSDLGMMLLAVAAERAAGMPLDQYLAKRVFAPLGMQSTMYAPPLRLHDAIVPTAGITERDFPLKGVVHDANSFRLGGIAGHAGIFSTARDLAVFAQMMLNGGSYGTLPILSPATVAAFTERQAGADQRALGWDTPSRVSSAGDYFSERSFGHTGYTGTSLWADRESGVFVVLLTNRTYVKASARDILRLRAAVHDAAARAVTDRPVRRRN